MKKTASIFRLLFFLGMMANSILPLLAEVPPTVEIPTIVEEHDDPLEESLNLIVSYCSSTGQITIETYVNQWFWVYIINAETGAVCSVDCIDASLDNGWIYHTYAPSLPGNYYILFQSYSQEAYGYFTIV